MDLITVVILWLTVDICSLILSLIFLLGFMNPEAELPVVKMYHEKFADTEPITR